MHIIRNISLPLLITILLTYSIQAADSLSISNDTANSLILAPHNRGNFTEAEKVAFEESRSMVRMSERKYYREACMSPRETRQAKWLMAGASILVIPGSLSCVIGTAIAITSDKKTGLIMLGSGAGCIVASIPIFCTPLLRQYNECNKLERKRKGSKWFWEK